jgi:hypothetical protein
MKTGRLTIDLHPADLRRLDAMARGSTRAAYARRLVARLIDEPHEVRDRLLAASGALPEDPEYRARLDMRMPRPLRRALRRWAGGYPVGDLVRGAIRAEAEQAQEPLDDPRRASRSSQAPMFHRDGQKPARGPTRRKKRRSAAPPGERLLLAVRKRLIPATCASDRHRQR